MNNIGKMGKDTANSIARSLHILGVSSKVIVGEYNRYGVEVWLKDNPKSFVLTTQLEANGAIKAIEVMR